MGSSCVHTGEWLAIYIVNNEKTESIMSFNENNKNNLKVLINTT